MTASAVDRRIGMVMGSVAATPAVGSLVLVAPKTSVHRLATLWRWAPCTPPGKNGDNKSSCSISWGD